MAVEITFTYVIYVSGRLPGLYILRKTGVHPSTLKYIETQEMVSSNIGKLRQHVRRLGKMRVPKGMKDHESIIETWL